MNKLFEKTKINNMVLNNRFVRSAIWEGRASEDGRSSQKLIDFLVERARGEIGLIITGQAYVRPDGQARPYQLGVHKDEHISGLRRLVEAVHKEGGKIALQVAHAGCRAGPKTVGQMVATVSCIEGLIDWPCKEMSATDIRDVVDAFGKAAGRAKEAGFDGVQIHAAHGYLLSQFMSPRYNKRTDDYGGSVENRARAVVEVVERIREAVGPDYPVMIKLNCEDFVKGGLDLNDSVEIGKMLAGKGVDAIEVSGGTIESAKLKPYRKGILTPDKEAYFQDQARVFKRSISAPLILGGGIRSFKVAQRLVQEGIADYIAMGRPLIREPHLIKRWKIGQLFKSTCESDNECFAPGMAGKGVYCVPEERLRREKELSFAE